MHIGKTGGTAIKRTLHEARLAYRRPGGDRKVRHSPFGPIKLESHGFLMKDLPDDHHVFFCVRDPIARFESGFYSRRSRGGAAYKNRYPWSEAEERVFGRFETAERLALALGSNDSEEREFAQWAMSHVRHLGSQRRFTGPALGLRERLERGQIVYIARQETLAADWENLKPILDLPPDLDLISDPERAHRRTDTDDRRLSDAAVRNLRKWYDRDYHLLDAIDDMRAERGWADKPRRGLSTRLRRTGEKAKALIPKSPGGRARWS